MMFKRRRAGRVFFAVAALYVVGLVWGYQRLLWAAISDLGGGELLRAFPSATWSRESTQVSSFRAGYLESRLPHSSERTIPQIKVSVKWNAFVLARVTTGYYVSPLGAEWKDCLYLCVFGGWMRVHTFSHWAA